MINMKNIFYFKKISKIGGTEQFLYEIAKKYNDYDITIYYDEADLSQLLRLKKYIRCIKREPNKKVVCQRAFFNFNIDMINDVESTENYYAFISHAIYQELGYKPPIEHPKLNHYIGVSKFARDKLNEYGEKIGLNIKAEYCYDPMTLENVEKVPILVSACRLDDKTKGGERTIKLIEALDRYCEKHNRQYLWLIFTNKTDFPLPSKNAVYMQPRVDVRPYIAMADWVLQLSNDMETYCYTTNEANGYGVPIVTTPLTVYKEFDVSDNERLILDWDCSNADEIAKQIFEKEVKPFKYKQPKDEWDKFLIKGKSTYKEERKLKVKIECITDYNDLQLNRTVHTGEQLIVDSERADVIIGKGLAKMIETIQEEEPKKKSTKKSKK